eukprot:TRINITY_DN24161_c0_g1_i1.p2 TRINITY_DN24161_c0_g1~~TRINITY_DN24161_c0_g1_i1.p2  ORF type:complete len:131 (+),score=39.97 TRINITY_DN24161_c0_g1_i1:49-441(+)
MSVVALPTYFSRVMHLMGGAVLFAAAVSPEMKEKMGAKGFAGLGMMILLSGLFNAHALQPKKMGAKAGTWRKMIYAGKISLFLVCTPLGDKAFGEHATTAKLASMALSVMIGSYARFYREAAVKEEEKNQ